jgi:type II secretory pathway pseudopilin PulG
VHASKYRYTAARLFYAVTLTATAVALFGWIGFPVALFVLLIWWQVLAGARREESHQQQAQLNRKHSGQHHSRKQRPGTRTASSKVELLVVLLIIGLLVGLLTPASSDSDPLRHAEISMKMVAKALREYHAEHGEYPPPVTCDAHGAPMHSWRALLLPYLDEEPLAAAYHFDEPWNGPHNASLAQYRPWHFRIYDPQQASSEELDTTATSMQALPLDGQMILVEHEDSRCNWLEPEPADPTLLERFATVPPVNRGFWHSGFFWSEFRGRLIVSTTNSFQIHPEQATEIQSVLARTSPSSEMLEIGQPQRHYHFGNILHLATFALVALYPIRWLHRLRLRNPPLL